MEYPETNKDTRAAVFTQLEYRLARTPDNGRMGVLLFGVAFLVLGIACVNVSNLLLSAVPARTREMAVRVALGAPRTRLLQQLLLESVILSSAGTLTGLLIASWCAGFLSSIRIGSDLPLGFETRVDERVGIYLGGHSRMALLTQRSEFFAEVFGPKEQTAENLGSPDTGGSPGCSDGAAVGFFRAFSKRPSDRRRTESWISFGPCADDGF